jgi:type IV secretory pathway VirB2 component (pilin)
MILINEALAVSMDDAKPLHTYVDAILQFVVTLVGVIAVLVIIISGILYMTSNGDTTRVQIAKKTLTGGIIGLVIAILSLVIVKTIVSFVQ